MRVLKKLLRGFGVLLAIVVVAMVLIERRRSISYMGEVVAPDEDYYTAELVASALESINASSNVSPPYRRDVHSKSHGCVRAEVQVRPDLPEAFRQGVFQSRGQTYRGWLRFSSGNTDVQSDTVRDARGFALKLTGVPGPGLLDLPAEAGTQDFIMINSPVFFIRNVAEYAKFARELADGSRAGYFFGGNSPNVFTWHLRDMYLALRTLKRPPVSLLHTQYHSLTAYKFGPSMNVKYSAKACTQQPVAEVDRRQPDFLREEMRAELQKGPACFDVMVQPQVQGKNMPIEDPTVLWSERDSPFVPVARVTVPQQEFDTPQQNAFCEQLSFSPWHAVPELRPLGGLNRVRKAVYLEDARYRRSATANGGSTPYSPAYEPRGWCMDLSGQPCPDGSPSSDP